MGWPMIPSASDSSTRIGQLALWSLVREAVAAPKPGLVDRLGSGSHDDMDFMTFVDSALALGPAFTALGLQGYRHGQANPAWAELDAESDPALLTQLREIGIEGEKLMFTATGGVNTHKGALFLVGLLAAVAGGLLGAGKTPDADSIRLLGARMVRGLADRELPEAGTNGGRAYARHGSRGVRGEAESALSSLDTGALELLRKSMVRNRIDDAACVDALLLIMRTCDDTTVLHRGGPEALMRVRSGASSILAAGGCRTADGLRELQKFSRELEAARISPGGSADILAAGLFLVRMEQKE